MQDLVIGVAILVLAAGTVGWTAWRTTRGWRRRRIDAVAVVPLLVVAVDLLWLRHDPRLAQWLPFSNLVVVGNLVPIGVGGLAGLVARRFEDDRTRRLGWSAALGAISVFSILHPLLGRAPQCDDHWLGGFCIQTTPYTCSPAAACTLLARHGIHVDEATMARDCLTRASSGLELFRTAGSAREERSRASGTTWQGLYRGLKLHTHGTEWDVAVRKATHAQLAAHRGRPLILFVELEPGADVDPRYQRDWGWDPGRRHTVVFYGFRTPDRVRIGDPSIGLEEWSAADLRVLWHGTLMELVPRR